MSTRTGFGVVELKDDFLLSADASGWNDNTENSGTAAILATTEDGFVELTTGATSGNRTQITGERVWRAESGGPLTFEAGIRIVTAITNKAVFVGFTDVTTIENPIEASGSGDGITTTAGDAVGFMYDTTATTGRWFLVGVDSDTDAPGAGVLAAAQSNATPVAGTEYSVRFDVTPEAAAMFYINQVLVVRTGTGWTNQRMTSAVSADVNLCPTALVEARTTAAQSLYVDFIYCMKGRNA